MHFLAPFADPPGGLVAEVYRQIEDEFGLLAEPFTLHRPVPELLAASWATFRETVMVEDFLDRQAKETIGVAISRSNRCPYCVDSHSIVLHALGAGATERVLGRRRWPRRRPALQRADPGLLGFAAWAESTGTSRAADAREVPYTPAQAAEAIGSALCFHYINRMVTPLLGATPLPSPRRWLRRPQVALAGRRLAAVARARRRRGASLRLLPPVEAPAHLAWAAGSPRVRDAFALLDAAVEHAVEALLEPPARERVRQHLAGWHGEGLAPGEGAWAAPLAGLAPAQGAAARLALLAARASYRIDPGEVAAFRAHHESDAALVGVLAWGSFQAARRISTWLPTALPLAVS